MKTTFGNKYPFHECFDWNEQESEVVVKSVKCLEKTNWIQTGGKKKGSLVPMNELSKLLAKANNPSICALDPTPTGLLKTRFSAILPSLASPVLSSLLDQPNQQTNTVLLVLSGGKKKLSWFHFIFLLPLWNCLYRSLPTQAWYVPRSPVDEQIILNPVFCSCLPPTNSMPFLTKHLSCTLATTLAVWNLIAKMAQIPFSFFTISQKIHS